VIQRYASVLYILGILITGFGGLMLIPLALSWLNADGAVGAYDEGVLITVASGLLLSFSVRKGRRDMRVRDSILLVALIWSLLPAFGALPLYLHIADLSWTDAYFEAVSGLTATGATVLSGLDALPMSINFWRTFMHWIGGLGVVVLAVAILPLLGFGGRSMLKAETPGPMKDAKITPRITETAKGLWVVYVILTVACALSLHYVGMEPWDALMHAFSIMGLGGFSTKDAVSATSTASTSKSWSSFLRCSPHQLQHAFPRPLEALVARLSGRRRGALLSRRSCRQLPCADALPVARRHLRRFSHHPALRHLPFGVARDFAGFRHHRLHAVAPVRPTVDALPRQFRRLFGFGRRRHQDDSRRGALQAGVA
jgi:hypothetical protein